MRDKKKKLPTKNSFENRPTWDALVQMVKDTHQIADNCYTRILEVRNSVDEIKRVMEIQKEENDCEEEEEPEYAPKPPRVRYVIESCADRADSRMYYIGVVDRGQEGDIDAFSFRIEQAVQFESRSKAVTALDCINQRDAPIEGILIQKIEIGLKKNITRVDCEENE